MLCILIQIGGLGITSIGAGLIAFTGRKLRMRDQVLVQEALNYPTMKDVQILIRSVLITTITVESSAAFVGWFLFRRQFDVLPALGIAIFHSVSTFNHAGFDILGGLLSYRNDVGLQLLTITENILGGFGFFVILDILRNQRFHKFSLHTKVVLTTSGFLDLTSSLLLKAIEGDSLSWVNAFFMGITSRTSGLTIANVGDFSNASQLLDIDVYRSIAWFYRGRRKGHHNFCAVSNNCSISEGRTARCIPETVFSWDGTAGNGYLQFGTWNRLDNYIYSLPVKSDAAIFVAAL